MSKIRAKLDKIHSKIDKLAKKGRDNVFEYYKLVDEIIDNGEFEYYEECLFFFYKIENLDLKDVDGVKKRTWNEILFQTNTSFSTKLKKMYDDKSLYQISFDIYLMGSTSSTILGQVKESDTYSEEAKFYVQNRDLAKLIASKKTTLTVTKTGATSSTILDQDDSSLSYDQNLLNKYSQAIVILLS